MHTRQRRLVGFVVAALVGVLLAGPAAADPVTVSVTVHVSGLSGKYVPYGVVRDQFGNRCSSTCTFDYAAGSYALFDAPWNQVTTLTALGPCGENPSCAIAVDSTPTLEVEFAPVTTQEITLIVYGATSGYGISPPTPSARVISNVMPACGPGGLEYGVPAPCTVTVPTFTTVMLAAQTDTSSDLFDGWSGIGACVGTARVCSFVADASHEIAAYFSVNSLVVIMDCNPLGLRGFNCNDGQLRVVVSSPTIGTVWSETGFNGDCSGNLSQQCGGTVEFPVGEPVHIELQVPDDRQTRFSTPCDPLSRSCDLVLEHGAYLRVAYMPASPGTPRNPRAVAGDGQVTVAWDAPDPPGIGPVTYTVTEHMTRRVVQTTSSTAVIDGLDNFRHYVVDVTASNQYGASIPTRSFDVVPVPAPTSYDVHWGTTDLARIDEMAAYLETDRSGVQRQAVYLTAFLVGLDPTAPPDPALLPIPDDDAPIVTSAWLYSELSVPAVVQEHFVLDGPDAHRFSVYLLSYLLGLTGH